MQDIKNIKFPYNNQKYYADISLFPDDMKEYQDPFVPKSDDTPINFNTCSKSNTEWTSISELNPDSQCVCKSSDRVSKIIEGSQFYKCK